MNTKLLTEQKSDLAIAGRIIKEGGLIAFPTETVYGLGADALNPDAVKKIYEAKGRPSDNPTIVHIADPEEIQRLTTRMTKDMERLMEAYWPGPMTLIVPRADIVPNVTTGNLDTVGVRMPDNEIARELIRQSGCPIAAPSANLSGKPSPTTAQHCVDDLDGKVDGIIMSQPCRIGIESTVIDMTGDTPMILRPGYLTKADLEETLGKEVLLDPTLNVKPEPGVDFHPKAPGMKYKHYAPDAALVLFQGERENVEKAMAQEAETLRAAGKRVKVILFQEDHMLTAAHDFFGMLREADKEDVDVILASTLPEEGIGFSVMNRMLKSAGYNIRHV